MSPTTTSPPAAIPEAASEVHATYRARLGDATRDEAGRRARARRISTARLACFVVLAVTAWMAFGSHAIGRAWPVLPAIVFVGLVIVHDRALRAAERATRVRLFFEDGLARLEHRFAGRGDAGERHRSPDHPYADDLDLFGPGSLYELLATTRSAAGSDRLAEWLKAPADPETIRARQAAVEELRPALELRLEIALAGAGPETGAIDGSQASARTPPTDRSPAEARTPRASEADLAALAAWAGRPPASLPTALVVAAGTATTLTGAGLALWIWTGAGPLPFVMGLLLQVALAAGLRARVAPVLAVADTPVRSLAHAAPLLACLERRSFAAPRLVALRAQLESTGRAPSAELEALRRLVDLRDARRNQFFAPIAAWLHWGTHVAIRLERWRARCGPRIGDWLAAAGELEALTALSGYAFEHPDDPFPEIDETTPRFEGKGLGHPLLPEALCVRNDLRLGDRPRALVMSGSNMSGKSTMLRTVGVNAVLALAGAPVRARRLVLSPLHVAASIRIVDSLQQGTSHFMAEILRLRRVVTIAREQPPALFLLDEILHGTNSHDRRIGAEAVIEGLVEAGALGIVTTHDLALTGIVPKSDGRLANVHFEDHLEAGEMRFDYRLREGVVEKSNALELMRSVGLEV